MSEKVSIREYARRMDCSEGMIRKLIKNGVIVKGVTRESGQPQIIVDTATQEWNWYRDPANQRNFKIEKQLASKGSKPAPPPDDDDGPVTGGSSLAQIRNKRAEVELALAALELRKKRGELVDRKKVYNALFAMGREVKQSIMGVPDRYIDAILSAPSRNEAHTVLTQALIEALQTMAEVQERDITT